MEAGEIFREFYCNFLAGNLEYLETVSGGPALAICKAEFKRRVDEKWEYKYQDLLDCYSPTFQSGEIGEHSKMPCFTT